MHNDIYPFLWFYKWFYRTNNLFNLVFLLIALCYLLIWVVYYNAKDGTMRRMLLWHYGAHVLGWLTLAIIWDPFYNQYLLPVVATCDAPVVVVFTFWHLKEYGVKIYQQKQRLTHPIVEEKE